MTALAAFDVDVIAFAAFAVDVSSEVADVVACAFVAAVVVTSHVVALVAAPSAAAHAIVEDVPPLPPRIVDRNSLAKLELRVEKDPLSIPIAHAVRVGSWVRCRIFVLVHSP